ncbi:SDR family NAD(P)-dependent oxidoreductase [Nocardioides aestuarii]|uniref:Oxidoreductase n=1 Tax=Nocardioides aestuarii TaxID=252231 RepID=A0ABW4TLS2_9ACTN
MTDLRTDLTWDLHDLPDQTGRRTLVTGCTVGGLGFHVALELARRGGSVVLSGRTSSRLDEAVTAIEREVPGADTATLVVDLADLTSVRGAATEAAAYGPIHCLVNNAGVMATPPRRTVDGFDLQLATNHLGPFLLTGLLLPQLVESGDGRVMAVSSLMHRVANAAPVDDPRAPATRHYQRWQTYARTKLANLLFTFELDRRLRHADLPVVATAAHPGYAGTHLVVNGQTGGLGGPVASIVHGANRAVSQSAADGALPLLMAATADIPGSTYCGPGGFRELRGLPRLVGCSRRARDEHLQARLWEVSEQAVGLAWP